jgi:hypothetical protein
MNPKNRKVRNHREAHAASPQFLGSLATKGITVSPSFSRKQGSIREISHLEGVGSSDSPHRIELSEGILIIVYREHSNI